MKSDVDLVPWKYVNTVYLHPLEQLMMPDEPVGAQRSVSGVLPGLDRGASEDLSLQALKSDAVL